MTVSVTLRGTKGTALTYQEVDENFVNIKTAVDGITSDYVTSTDLTVFSTKSEVASSLTNYVTTATTQTVSGTKSFTGNTSLKGVQETVYNWNNVSAGTYTIDATSGTIHRMTLTGNVTISAFTNPQAGQSVTLVLAQDSTGNRTLTSTMKFAGSSKTLSTSSNAIDTLSIFYDGTNYLSALVKGYA
jgi:hypothetical protein